MDLRLNKTRLITSFKGIVALGIFCLLLFGIRYTDDWYGYAYFFENPEASPDLLFKYLAIFFATNDLSYIKLFQFHILVIGICLSFFISKFSSFPIILLLSFLLISFVPLVNQIRFFLAFGIFLVSVYYFLISKKKIKAFFLLIIAAMSHLAIIPLFVIFFIFNRIENNSLKYLYKIIIFFSVIITVIYYFLIYQITGHFSAYAQGESISTFLGGLYLVLPILLVYIYIYNYYKIICKRIPELLYDFKFKVLFIISIFTSPLLLIGFTSQIIVHRYISVFTIVWLIYILYPLTFQKTNKQYILISFFSFLVYLIALTYIIPYLVFGENEYIVKAILTLRSME